MNKCLGKFYVSAKRKDGSYYKRNSLLSVRAAFDRYLKSPKLTQKFSSARYFNNHLSNDTKTVIRLRLVNTDEHSLQSPSSNNY